MILSLLSVSNIDALTRMYWATLVLESPRRGPEGFEDWADASLIRPGFVGISKTGNSLGKDRIGSAFGESVTRWCQSKPPLRP